MSFLVKTYGQADLRNAHPTGRWYGVSTFDMLFSNGDFVSNGITWKQEVRFAPVLNIQLQNHYNWKSFGVFTGLGIRNIGFIHSLARDTADRLVLYQRSYSLNVPLALKIGNMTKGRYFALGVEAHYLFHYKSKLREGEEKTKYKDWFSDRVDSFNASVFADLRFRNGSYFRMNIFLADFLSERTYEMQLPASGGVIQIRPETSTLFYFSFGTALKVKKKQPLTLKDV